MADDGDETTTIDLRTVKERIIDSIEDAELRVLFAGTPEDNKISEDVKKKQGLV